MNSQFSDSQPKLDKAMTTEQFNRIVEAILAGKYSWACVLILRYAGYNPLHYIPYTTYIRLVKDNPQGEAQNRKRNLETKAKRKFSQGDSSQLTDLSYLETIEEKSGRIRGGNRSRWGNERLESYCSLAKNLSFNFKRFGEEFLSRIRSTGLTSKSSAIAISKNRMDDIAPSSGLNNCERTQFYCDRGFSQDGSRTFTTPRRASRC
ncbi:MAG: HetP family heterocyst commitment protein [Hydrococcus sp. C42_A2020_068]|uniref:HetP family heterocyst commitment protein n=1 Tax=Pleurocapsa sp. PCC 7327 TaxID=118163 RepID=UPI00029F9011|nr:HetP family heterocyst commitment protein [Pleurocapsa sp. PCC 7327]AFY75611.1 hypothetical protein Ple7327_0127 [Pleurocapsa sp. PCC 7327]MBF2022104.1 HetP family heterocyst commitment protein [Hydrococcus sp. C42_A2020_068]